MVGGQNLQGEHLAVLCDSASMHQSRFSFNTFALTNPWPARALPENNKGVQQEPDAVARKLAALKCKANRP